MVLVGYAAVLNAVGELHNEPLDVVPSVMRKLRKTDLVSSEQIPVVAGAITAESPAFSTAKWRDLNGRLVDAEMLVRFVPT